MITHEKATDKNIITKQVVINTPTSARLLPITADEKVIDEIQQALNELERLKKFKETFDNYELAKKQDFIAYENWLECEAELKKSPTAEEVCDKKLELYKRLFNVCKEYKYASIGLSDDSEFLNVMSELEEKKNEKRNKRF